MDSSESADKESKTTLTPSTSKDKGSGQEFSQLLSNMLRSSDCIINLTTMNVKRIFARV